MQSYQICSAESPTCANSIATSSFSTDDHSLDNYIKLKAIAGAIQSLTQNLQYGALRITKNLRKIADITSSNWAD